MHDYRNKTLRNTKATGTEIEYEIEGEKFTAIITYMSIGAEGNFYEPPEGDELEFELYDSEGNEVDACNDTSDMHSDILWDILREEADRAKYDY